MIERFRRVLFLGAHPDDEMGCSGTIAKLVQSGAVVDAVTFSDCADLIPEGFTVDDLTTEWYRAMRLIGVENPTMGQVPNRLFPAYRQSVLETLDHFRGRGYDLILCPATFDAHQDHSTVSTETIRAFKQSTILGYELPMNEVNALRLSGFVHLDERQAEMKVLHAATYTSQSHRPYMAPAFIRGLLKVRGVQAGCDAAEAFEVIRWHF